MLALVALLSLVTLSRSQVSQCESECTPVSTRLSACALPPITTDRDTLRSEFRNLTGLSWDYPSHSGPFTGLIESSSEAECFCIDGVHTTQACLQCLSVYRFENFIRTMYDEEFIIGTYQEDCNSFGYFANESLAYPTTTRSTMPASPTASSLNGNTCGNICGVIRAQTEECDLTALDLEDLPRQINVDSAYRGNVLLNRTAAECMCSMPVLRRFRGCRKCIESDRDAGSLDIVDFYQEECNELGYWSDDAVVEPEAIEEDDGEADVSDESPTDGVGMAMYISTGALAVSISAMCVLSGGLL